MSLTEYEIYVKALLLNRTRMEERGETGAKWNVVEELSDLDSAIKRAGLTDRQREVITLYSKEYQSPEIAEILRISQQTVSFHWASAVRKIANIYESWEALN